MSNQQEQHFLNDIPNLLGYAGKIGVVTAQWNSSITSKLKLGALDALNAANIAGEQIIIWDVPGSYELVFAAEKMLNNGCDAVICLGVVIQGETPHFDFICNAVANGLAQITIKHCKPVAFGVLTTLTQLQAEERAGGKHGNKGHEAAVTVLQLLSY